MFDLRPSRAQLLDGKQERANCTALLKALPLALFTSQLLVAPASSASERVHALLAAFYPRRLCRVGRVPLPHRRRRRRSARRRSDVPAPHATREAW